MKREIKFRAWDKINKIMYSDDEDELLHKSGKTTIDRYVSSDEDNYEMDEEPIVMQFTGLKDKNGVDIYEGDIVEVQKVGVACECYGECECNKVRNIVNTQVVWIEKEMGFDYRSTKNKDWNIGVFGVHHSTAKVVGNIHENPELLKEQK